MNKQEITTVLAELHRISGFRISLHNERYEEIAAYPESPLPFCERVNADKSEHERCIECDRAACMAALRNKGTYIYRCRYGLTEAVSPLYNFDTLTGFLMMGQVADSAESKQTAARIVGLSGDTAGLAEGIPVIKPDMISSYVRIMTICAQYLTLSNALPSRNPSTAELAKKYILENLSSKLTITGICDSLGCSKSTLLTSFKARYGITVNTFITDERLRLAKRLLREGAKSVYEISVETGFSDQSYFSKVFSAKFGIPPSEYKHTTGSEE